MADLTRLIDDYQRGIDVPSLAAWYGLPTEMVRETVHAGVDTYSITPDAPIAAGFKMSVERLVHFHCGHCTRWWSIGDAPARAAWFCPWCGQRNEAGQPPADEAEAGL